MLELRGDIWKLSASSEDVAIVVSTNGCVKTNGEAVMGKGIAGEAAARHPKLAAWLGVMLKREGNHVFLFSGPNVPVPIITFPTKPRYATCNKGKGNVIGYMQSKFGEGDDVPGWACVSSLKLIGQSLKELVALAATHPEWKHIYMPRPGCGAGEKSWSEIKPLLEEALDDRFIVCTY